MRLSIKTKQVAGVVLLVGLAVTILSGVYTALIAKVHLEETESRGVMLKQFIFERALRVITSRDRPYETLQNDPGLRSLLESSMAYSQHVVYAAIVDPRNVVIVHSSPMLEGQTLEPQPVLDTLLAANAWKQLEAVSSDRTFEVTEKLLLREEGSANEQFGAIRIGISTTLIWKDVLEALGTALYVGLSAIAVSTLLALLMAQWTLRPVHVLKSGLTRLGHGEFDVKLDLPPGDEFSELGTSFNQLSAELSAVRSQLATGQAAPVESVVDRLEDAVAMVNPDGMIVFANSAIRTALPEAAAGSKLTSWPELHPYRRLVERALSTRRSQGPAHQMVLIPGETGETEQWLMAHAVEHADQRFMGVMLVARDVGYITQVQSTLRYSRKAASLGRLLAGVAHEVKNPLNAMTIHLELLKQKLGGGRPAARSVGSGMELARGAAVLAAESEAETRVLVEVPAVMKHVTVIGAEIRRLDEVVQGFLKFSRPEELNLEPVDLSVVVAEVAEVVEPQGRDVGVRIINECPPTLPRVSADRPLLRQALLNLALNAVQSMSHGGVLRFVGRVAADRQVSLDVEDTGVGIPPEHLSRIFDLYFTTREGGSGIGLSMVFRTIQLHDGHIEVQSTPGRGTTFSILLPQA